MKCRASTRQDFRSASPVRKISIVMAGRSMSENGGRMMSRLVVWDWVWNLDPRPKGPLYVAQCLRNVTEPLEAHQIGISLGTV